ADPSDAVRARVTTRQAIDDERALLRAADRGRGRGATLAVFEPAPGLGEDQAKVVGHILGSADRPLAVEGKAGTGKTRVLAHIRIQAEAAGWRVRGVAPTTTAVDVLREGGIEAVTAAGLLHERPLSERPANQLWIVDEAGLLSSRQAR